MSDWRHATRRRLRRVVVLDATSSIGLVATLDVAAATEAV
jgi:hypothetical protein